MRQVFLIERERSEIKRVFLGAVGNFFMVVREGGLGGRGGGLSRNVEAVPQKTKFGPKYKWFEISYLQFLFWIYYSAIHCFYICSDVPMDIIRVFFNFRFSIRKSQSQQKLAKKITHFTTVSLKKTHSFYEPQLTRHWK